jgi:hypothetical protein
MARSIPGHGQLSAIRLQLTGRAKPRQGSVRARTAAGIGSYAASANSCNQEPCIYHPPFAKPSPSVHCVCSRFPRLTFGFPPLQIEVTDMTDMEVWMALASPRVPAQNHGRTSPLRRIPPRHVVAFSRQDLVLPQGLAAARRLAGYAGSGAGAASTGGRRCLGCPRGLVRKSLWPSPGQGPS